jgi:hypothetical protein
MAVTFDTAVDRLVLQFGSENQATIVAVVNEKQREMLAMAESHGSTPTLGTTSAGVVQYATDATVSSYRLLRVGTTLYTRVDTATLWALQDADSGTELSGPGGVFALTYDDSGVEKVELYPQPDAGLTIEVLAYGWIADAVYGATTALAIPLDLFSKLLSGCRAYLLREVEERSELAAAEEQDYQNGIAELRARRFRRVGGGATRARIGVGGRY